MDISRYKTFFAQLSFHTGENNYISSVATFFRIFKINIFFLLSYVQLIDNQTEIK
jgi:hypothetical protein